jgi:hypothetical protein
METDLLTKQLSRLTRAAFREFLIELFSADRKARYHSGFYPLPIAGEDVFYEPYLDSYGDSIHNVYLLHFPPFELFHPSSEMTMLDPVLIRQLARVRNVYHRRIGQWGMVSPHLRKDDALKSVGFLTNLFGLEKPVHQDFLVPAYQRLKRYCGLKRPPVLVGSVDSFIELSLDETQQAVRRLVEKHRDGIVVTVAAEGVQVGEYASERYLSGGVLSPMHMPLEPVFVSFAVRQRAIFESFRSLLQEDAVEVKLEEFLVAHFRELFGEKYDRIETQLWMRFPELDVGGKNRRFDLFLRNSVINDWELFEVKRPVVLSSTYRDIPVIAKEVTGAIHQARNYARILAQEKAKRHFSRLGIEYCEPSLNVVIGRTPEISHEQWRWLRTVNEDKVKIITFDDLLNGLRCRLEDRYALMDETRCASHPASAMARSSL